MPVEITYGIERLEMFLEDKDNIFDLNWSQDVKYGQLRLREEREFSEYNFRIANIKTLNSLFEIYEREAINSINRNLLLPSYDYCLKCSHIFNLLDSRGAISVTERVKFINRIRNIACLIAEKYKGGQIE